MLTASQLRALAILHEASPASVPASTANDPACYYIAAGAAAKLEELDYAESVPMGRIVPRFEWRITPAGTAALAAAASHPETGTEETDG